MTIFTVQCGSAVYYYRTETVEAETLDEALEKAIAAANAKENWGSTEVRGSAFVDAVAEGDDVDLWSNEIKRWTIPARFTECEPPTVTVTVSGGVVQNVAIVAGKAHVFVHDYDTDGADENDPNTKTDTAGDRYALADWSNVIPTADAAE